MGLEQNWERAVSRFHILETLAEADQDWGPLGDAEAWLSLAGDDRERRAFALRVEKETRRHMTDVNGPLIEAAEQVMRTPAPTLEALRFKRQLARDYPNVLDGGKEAETFAHFMADAERLLEALQ